MSDGRCRSPPPPPPALTDQFAGARPRSDDQRQDDPHCLSVLQHLRENDLSAAQGHQPDDQHLQELPVAGRGPHLGPQQVRETSEAVTSLWDDTTLSVCVFQAGAAAADL